MRILRLKDSVVKEALMLSERAEHRKNRKRCVVAGTKLVKDLSRRHRIHDLLIPKGAESECEGLDAENVHVADAKSLRRIAQLTQFDGLAAVVDMPTPTHDLSKKKLVLCLDHIEQPGLLGTLLRTAMAFQWHAVYFLPNCVDPFDAKCLRASNGALFDLPFKYGSLEDLRQLCQRNHLQFCTSHIRGVDIGSSDYVPPPHGLALLLREEYATPWGPPRDALKLRIPDPWRDSEESLPEGEQFEPRALDVAVAGGILMHHIRYFHYASSALVE